MVVTKEQYLDAQDVIIKAVKTAQWPEAYVRTMTGQEHEAWEAEAFTRDDAGSRWKREAWRARLLVFTMCDAEGNLLFTEADIPALNAKNASALAKCAKAAMQLNRIGEDEIEELEKN